MGDHRDQRASAAEDDWDGYRGEDEEKALHRTLRRRQNHHTPAKPTSSPEPRPIQANRQPSSMLVSAGAVPMMITTPRTPQRTVKTTESSPFSALLI